MTKFPGHCPIFTEVIAEKYIKQRGRQIDNMRIKNIFKTEPPWSRDLSNSSKKKSYQNRSILLKNIGEQTLKNTYTDELYNLLLLES